MKNKRIPLPEETISGEAAVREYDKGARRFMTPQYKYFVRKILRRGIRGGKVLEIGGGSGRMSIELARAKSGFHVTLLDLSADMLNKAIENAGDAGIAGRMDFVQANASAIPFADKTFDLVISYASLHHWREPLAVFNEAARVVKETGTVIIRDNKRVYHNPFWRVFIWLVTLFMNKRHRENWPRAILAGYTIPEIKAILAKSNLKGYRVISDFIRFDMSIEPKE